VGAPPTVIECHDCGLFQHAPPPMPGRSLACDRCEAQLERAFFGTPALGGLCACGAFVLLVLALRDSVFKLELLGRHASAGVLSGPRLLEERGYTGLGIVVILLLSVAPLLHFSALAWAAIGARVERPGPSWFLPLAFAHQARRWSMIDVYLLAGLVCYVRLDAWARVEVGRAIPLLLALLALSTASSSALPARRLWQRVALREHAAGARRIACPRCGLVEHANEGDRCRRCTGPLHPRRRSSNVGTAALLIAALLLSLPANLLPVMTMVRFGRAETDTIFSGVLELIRNDLWGLAIVIFVASIVVPCLKILVMAILLAMTHVRSDRYLLLRTRAYRVVAGIGRWSLVDVFAVTLLVSLVHMGKLAVVLPGQGALAFCVVVVLTMIAAELFDPRRMWDAAGLNASESP
jgi:paraquat-inducible protein A